MDQTLYLSPPRIEPHIHYEFTTVLESHYLLHPENEIYLVGPIKLRSIVLPVLSQWTKLKIYFYTEEEFIKDNVVIDESDIFISNTQLPEPILKKINQEALSTKRFILKHCIDIINDNNDKELVK